MSTVIWWRRIDAKSLYEIVNTISCNYEEVFQTSRSDQLTRVSTSRNKRPFWFTPIKQGDRMNVAWAEWQACTENSVVPNRGHVWIKSTTVHRREFYIFSSASLPKNFFFASMIDIDWTDERKCSWIAAVHCCGWILFNFKTVPGRRCFTSFLENNPPMSSAIFTFDWHTSMGDRFYWTHDTEG